MYCVHSILWLRTLEWRIAALQGEKLSTYFHYGAYVMLCVAIPESQLHNFQHSQCFIPKLWQRGGGEKWGRIDV